MSLKETFSQKEERILKLWKDKKIFEESLSIRKASPHFTFYDGPPFATGLPHYGHLLAGTIKDVVPRYKTMKGYYVPRRFGWDCHGLPVEQEIEKSKQLSGAHAIEEFGIAAFNEECRSIVQRYTKEWESTVLRMGRWVSFDNTYKTMDLTFMESVWWVFKELFEKGLVYEGYKVMPYSAKLGTPLSNFEAGENYHDVDDPAITVAFPLIEDPTTCILAWTTTPWTLVSNLALMVGPDITYVKVWDAYRKKHYIFAESRLSAVYKDPSEYEIKEKLLGKDLEGIRYSPPFDYFASKADEDAFRVILEPTVSLDDGTGVVHSAPAFGEVDFYACKREGISLVCPVDQNGLFTDEIPEYQGLFVKDADKQIIQELKKRGVLFHQATIHHRYPFCWRSDTPLIYKAVSTWFVAVEKIKDRLIAANQKIHWMPEFIKDGRFGKWLEGARDWAISRNRYWGTPIPIWRSPSGKLHVIGSIEELEKRTGTKVTDLHRHFIDQLTIEIDGELYSRVTEVFDCWFESGSMPYAQAHYPFENQELFKQNFPADFIAEGLDQTRGWFYTLTILSTALFDQPAFKNCVVNGIILAEDGAKMSKRLKNYPDPNEMINQYGADAIRLYMLNSPAVLADDLCFSKAGVELVLRQVLIPLWNAHQFFSTYAKIYEWTPREMEKKPSALIDRWMVSMLHRLIHQMEEAMDRYNLQKAVIPMVEFIDQLTNWYIRRSRRRFWSDQATADRDEAFLTLYHVLKRFSQVAAPFIPFMTETIYQDLKLKSEPESVHLTDYPVYHSEWRDTSLEQAMAAVQQVVSLGHALRKTHKLKVRQPLSKAYVATKNEELITTLKAKAHLIQEELNVKDVEFTTKEETFVTLVIKPNFRILGKKVGALMPALKQEVEKLPQSKMQELLSQGKISLPLGEQIFDLLLEDVEVQRIVKEDTIAQSEGGMTVVLETTLNDDLILEGLAREIVNKLNTMRREGHLDVTDRIKVEIDTTPKVEQAFHIWKDYITDEVLATEVKFQPNSGQRWDINDESATIFIEKVST